MSIPRRFHCLHPSVPPVCLSGRYGSSRCALADYRFCLSAPAVHSSLRQYTDTGSAVCLRCFPESSASCPTGRWCGCMVCHLGLAGVFQSSGRGHRRRSRSVQYVDTHFGQAVFGMVMIILGTAGGLFAADMPMRYQFSLKVVINSLPPDFKSKIYYFSIVFLMLPTLTFLLLITIQFLLKNSFFFKFC